MGTALLAPQIFGIGQRKGGPVVTTPRSGGTVTTPVTHMVPSTQTTCPKEGTTRPAVQAPLVLGSQPNLIYTVNEFNPLQGTIKRRQVGADHDVEIVKMPNVTISEAQVSRDGQWVLFDAMLGKQEQIRMVRVDRQGLQTLYCAPAGSIILNSQWSFNQEAVAFDVVPGGTVPTMYLLNVTRGTVQPEHIPHGSVGYLPRTWLDATHVYLTAFNPQMRDASLQNIYLHETQKGIMRQNSDLQKVVTGTQYCTSFDTSYDVQSLYVATCTGDGSVGRGYNGPSNITITRRTWWITEDYFQQRDTGNYDDSSN